jgi:transcriptional regulator with XRE-family HTH domain
MTPLKKSRLLSGKRQIDVFNETRIWPGRLSMLENGLLRPRQEEIELLAKVYRTSPEQLSRSGGGQEQL